MALLPVHVSLNLFRVEEKVRARVETHLRGCRSCLDAYLSLKLSAAEPAAWLWWERPLAVAFAAAAVALATITVSEL